MKKLICILCAVLLAVPLCSCKSVEDKVFMSDSSVPTMSSETAESSSEPLPSSSSQPVSSQPPESSSEPSSLPALSVAAKPEVVSSAPQSAIAALGITVTDPDNTRGLATEKKGFSFGVAANGVAHNQSFLNQQGFDALQNVKALALDTKAEEKVMYLTFDNGYEYKNLTASILDTLLAKDVKAAFFVTLSYVKQNKALVKRMIDEGHIVGNHSATHPSFPSLTRTQMAEEIAMLDKYLRDNFGYTSPYFRFPSGEHSECSLELVSSIGFRSVFWSVAYADWSTSEQKGADYAYDTVTSRFHPGAVILLHAVSDDNTRALGRIIDKAISDGYSFRTLDEYFK